MSGRGKIKSSTQAIRHHAFDESDGEDGPHHAHPSSSNTRDEIVSFGPDGARTRTKSTPPAAPRVIPVASNLDWRQDRKQRLGMAANLQSLGPLVSMRRADSSAVPGSTDASTSSHVSNSDAINTEAQKRGLELRTPKPRTQTTDTGSTDHAQVAPSTSAQASNPLVEEVGTDQEAIKALLTGEDADGLAGSGAPLIIPQELESEMLQHDIDSRPEAPTLDDYAATPIDQFGMALLRGMGWKEGMGAGKGGRGPQQAPEPKKRAALLGLGAKERPAGSPGLASSSATSRDPRSGRRDHKYIPVSKGDGQSASNGRSDSPEKRYRDDSPRGPASSRGEYSKDRLNRNSSSRSDSRHHSSRISHRERSRSPKRSRDDDRDRHRERRRDDRDSEKRLHASSRSERDRKHIRDRDDRRRDHHR